jgi:hypothetical protein
MAAAPAAAPRAARKGAPEIPPLLLEGDAAPAPPVSGPGQRYALRPAPAPAPAPPAPTPELPEAYGTKKLLLTARDPHWLYAAWDLTREQLNRYNALSTDGHLVVRVYRDQAGGPLVNETHVHPESRNWFIHVGVAGAKFVAELGYYLRGGKWVSVSTSGATVTPPDTMSEDFTVTFETLPADLQLNDLLRFVKSAVPGNVPLVEAIQQLRASGHGGLPEPRLWGSHRWTPEQEAALARLISMDQVRRVWIGSLEITELIRRQFFAEISSLGVSMFAWPASWSGAISSITSVSSPFGGVPGQKSFWFNVNAELIIYGATEPSASVTIGGRPIKLRPDGTFSYRFALPDGQYHLPAVATSADGTDSRTAALSFSRGTEYRGDVGQHPQDARLKPPRAENVA